jgi:hypothetical protein
MASNDETLGLIITETGADSATAKLNKLDAATAKVVKTTKAQTEANKAETRSLLDLERALVKGKKLWEEYGSAKSKAGKSSGTGGGPDSDKIVGATGRAADAVSPQAGAAIRAFEDVRDFGRSLSDVGKLAVGAGVGIGVAAAALSVLQAQAAKVKEAATVELNARADVIAFIQTATQAEIEARREELQQKQAIAQAVANDANSVLAQTEAQTNAIGKLNASLGTNQGELSAAREAADKANKALGETNTALSLIDQAAKAGFASERDYTKAIEETNKIRTSAALAGAADEYNRQLKLQQDAQLTSAQLGARITATIQEENAAHAALNKLLADQKRGVTGLDAEITRLQVQIGKTGGDLTRLYGLFADRKSIEAAGDALKYTQEQATETAAAVKKYNDEIAALNERDTESREKLRDALISIVEEAEKAAQDALNTLLEARATIAQDFNRDEDKASRDAATERINLQIDSYRQELDIYKNYKRQLRNIEKRAQDDSFDLILNRDFSGLFNLNRGTEIAKRDAGQAERDAIEDARESRQRQVEDLVRSLEVERQERLIALNQRLLDANAAYVQEQLQIAAQRKDAEAKANAARVKEKAAIDQQYAIKQQAAQNELSLISQTEQQRVAIMAAAQNALIQQAQRLLAAVSGSVGSSAAAGAGAGMQFNLNQNFNGGGMNEQRVAELSAKETRKVLQRYFT